MFRFAFAPLAMGLSIMLVFGVAAADSSDSGTDSGRFQASQGAPRHYTTGSQSPFANVHHGNSGGSRAQAAGNPRVSAQGGQRSASVSSGVRRHNLGSQSPFANIHHHRDIPGQRHVASVTTIQPRDDQTVISWPGGFIIPGERGWRWPSGRVWVSGRYEVRYQQVYVAGYWTQQYVPPVYEHRMVNGRMVNFMVQPGRYENVYVPGRYEMRPVRVYVPGHWR